MTWIETWYVMSLDRQWMYARSMNGILNREFLEGLETFIQFATSQPVWMGREKIRCLCNHHKWKNTKYLEVGTAKHYLVKHGFILNYFVWTFQRERAVRVDIDQDVSGSTSMTSEEASNTYHIMVLDTAGPEFNVGDMEEPPILRLKSSMTCWQLEIKGYGLGIKGTHN